MTVTEDGRSTQAQTPITEPMRRRLTVHGVVQGVGFRPFVWRLAQSHGLAGWVRNTPGAVVIEAEGEAAALDAFADDIVNRAPRLARVTSLTVDAVALAGATGFLIDSSTVTAETVQSPPPDAVVCSACLAELRDLFDRRYRYPFTNCTDCGPRFTIITALPYDRERTVMRRFVMCDACRQEYEDPSDRRFHAEPVACPQCGPRLWLAAADGTVIWGDPIDIAAAALRDGAIVGVKGLGGFQLACDATDEAVVGLLRQGKHRPAKPLAVMVGDISRARAIAEVDAAAADALSDPSGPIVLIPLLDRSPLAAGIVDGLDEVGVMLPSTPLHHLLLGEVGRPLVMTSGNISDEPICRDNEEAIDRLGGLVDLFLLHDREIVARYDDSVTRPDAVVRAGRGLTPTSLPVREATVPGVAFGAHLKNTFALISDGRVLLSPHLGDLDNPLALENAAAMLDSYLRLFQLQPRAVACDLHPDYASTVRADSLADEIGVEPVRVQHHHAHIASVMAEHDLRGAIVGVALDGTGLGPDGTVWGGEVLVADELGARRAGRIATVRQPGGDRCARDGWRMAAAYLNGARAACDVMPAWWRRAPTDTTTWTEVSKLAARELSPVSSSAGRLFDAVASVLDIAHHSTYEGEAASRLETAARRARHIPVITADVVEVDGCWIVDTIGLVNALADLRRSGGAPDDLAAAFHAALGAGLADVAARVANRHGLNRVALSGGCFQNRLLLGILQEHLSRSELQVFTNRRVPANDGGISVGQALVLAATTEAAR